MKEKKVEKKQPQQKKKKNVFLLKISSGNSGFYIRR
jgi:hypothetical protein